MRLKAKEVVISRLGLLGKQGEELIVKSLVAAAAVLRVEESMNRYESLWRRLWLKLPAIGLCCRRKRISLSNVSLIMKCISFRSCIACFVPFFNNGMDYREGMRNWNEVLAFSLWGLRVYFFLLWIEIEVLCFIPFFFNYYYYGIRVWGL